MDKNRITAIVLAAGKGKRMNMPVAKQFLKLRDKPVLYYSLRAFEDSSVDEIILVTGSDQMEYCREHIVSLYNINKAVQIIEGGNERYSSVYQALKNVKNADYVLIHDGARPFITVEMIEYIIQQVKKYKACIIGTPVKETIKVVNQEGYIMSTPDRSNLWSAQTPQAFSYAALRRAYDLFYEKIDKSRLLVTDDAMVYETYMKKQVKMLKGDYRNLKITTEEDMIWAKVIVDGMKFK
jgi:2-C-methyl-D-erythritol 4-phosphate cytidylyltransferase